MKQRLMIVGQYTISTSLVLLLAISFVNWYFPLAYSQGNPGEPVVGATPPPSASPQPNVNPAEPSQLNNEQAAVTTTDPGPLNEVFLEPYLYDPKGRRDPFRPLGDSSNLGDAAGDVVSIDLPLQQFDLDQLQLLGVIWRVNNPKAMIKDPNERVYVVSKDERVGRNNGYVAVIRESEVVIVEAPVTNGEVIYQTRILRLPR